MDKLLRTSVVACIVALAASCGHHEPEIVTKHVESVAVSPAEITIDENGKTTLIATVLPEDASDKSLRWSSSDPAVATVSGSGIVSAAAPGQTTVTATSNDGNFTSSCTVTVTSSRVGVVSISLDREELSMNLFDPAPRLNATIVPDNATDKTVLWSSSDPSVASVDGNGNVRATGAGTATISATAAGGNDISASCTVKVYESFPLRIMSFNILQGGKKDGSTDQAGHEWSTVRRAPCVKMFKETDPDIIMLQECRREELNDLKADLGGYDYYSYAKDGVLASGYSEGDATNDASFKNGGQRNVIMLRGGMFEMIQWGRFWLSDTPDVPSTGFGTTGQKITLWLKLRHRESNTLFYVFNTHFIPQTYATDAVPDCISPSGRVNIEQIKTVLGDKTTGGKGDCPETVFFAGDMNAPNTDGRMAVVNDYMYCSRVSAPESDNSMTYNGFRTDPATWYNLDHIYYKNATPLVFKVVNGDGYGTRFISDHFPVYADFRVNIR